MGRAYLLRLLPLHLHASMNGKVPTNRRAKSCNLFTLAVRRTNNEGQAIYRLTFLLAATQGQLNIAVSPFQLFIFCHLLGSACPHFPKADVCSALAHARFGPTADSCTATKKKGGFAAVSRASMQRVTNGQMIHLVDHIVGAHQNRLWDFKSEGPCSL
jgi:hypothetical protein